MRKRISIGTAIAAVLLCCLATFQITFLLTRASFEKKYLSGALDAVHVGSQSGNAGEVTGEGGNAPAAYGDSQFLSKLTEKISEVDAVFRSYYID